MLKYTMVTSYVVVTCSGDLFCYD